MSDKHRPQWEDCKVCGGDHWTKDHPKACLAPGCDWTGTADDWRVHMTRAHNWPPRPPKPPKDREWDGS